jgi:hypothetical protein
MTPAATRQPWAREAPDPVELRRAADGKNIPNFFIVCFGRSGSTLLYTQVEPGNQKTWRNNY